MMPRFSKKARILRVLKNDSYLVKEEDNKIIKRNHAQITSQEKN